MSENVDRFTSEFAGALTAGTFVKMTLGNYKGVDPHLQKIHIRLVKTKKGTRLFFLYRSETRDTAKNFDLDTGVALVVEALDGQFFSGHLFTTTNDVQLDVGKKGKSRLNVAKPTFKQPPALEHDREKRLQVSPDRFYLNALGITDDSGRVRDRSQDKWRQINKFVEVLASLVDKSDLSDRTQFRIVDMGSGKGYLTFAAYDYFRNIRGVDVSVTGVDTKTDLVGLGNDIAKASGFDGLNFVVGSIGDYDIGNVDILIALHACNTATDEAIFKGIAAKADLIVAAPCCHQQIRPQLQAPEMFRDILKHGVMLERTAEIITDGLRSLLLERSGYSTKLFEFVATEHTPKNNMLVGTRAENDRDTVHLQQQIDEIKRSYGISEQRLEQLLRNNDDLA
jgi:SAM-dependent methyltransferase